MPMVDIAGVGVYRSDPDGVPRGAVIVIHEIWGLNPHTKDIADRFAREGYLAVAPDVLSEAGITPEVGAELHALRIHPDEAKRLSLQPLMREKLAPARTPEYAALVIGELRSVVDALEAVVGDRVVVTGFCFGGTYAFALAAADSRIRAAVPFYGTAPDRAGIATIGCPVLALYGAEDPPLMEALPGVKEAMADEGIDFSAHVYDDAPHAFFNDTNPLSYRAEAAADAWTRTLEFFAAALRR